MSEYNQYVIAINKIFEIIGQIKLNYTDKDNLAQISKIEEYKPIVIKSANSFSNKKINPQSQDEKNQNEVEEEL